MLGWQRACLDVRGADSFAWLRAGRCARFRGSSRGLATQVFAECSLGFVSWRTVGTFTMRFPSAVQQQQWIWALCWLAGAAEFRGRGEGARRGTLSRAHGGGGVPIGMVRWTCKRSVVSGVFRWKGFRVDLVAGAGAARISVVFWDAAVQIAELHMCWMC